MLCMVVPVHAADITAPGDTIVGVPNQPDGTEGGGVPWPAGEAPHFAIDNNVDTKYLHFLGDKQPTGFHVTPAQAGKIVGGLTFTTANDSDGRDPVKYELYGSNESINGPWTIIHAGDIVDFARAAAWPRKTINSTQIRFLNTQPYNHYRLMFTQIRNATANSMQISEVELLEAPPTGWAPEVSTPRSFLVRLPDNTIQLSGSATDFDTPVENLTHQWSLYSGPAAVDFGGTEGEYAATVTFPEVTGVYELLLQVSDGVNDANNVTLVRVWDPATEDAVIAHWPMNDGMEATTVTDVVNGNNGVVGSHALGVDPNFAPGWIPADDPANFALNFYDYGFVRVAADPNAAAPNLDNVQWSISIAAWFNATSWGTNNNRRILQKGLTDNQYRLLVQSNQLMLHLAGVGQVTAPLPTAKLWHHVAGTYDGATMKLYLDGIEVGSQAATGLIQTSRDPLFIGCKSDQVDPTVHPGDYFTGLIDDVWIYNYALNRDEIIALTAMGENAPPGIVGIEAPAELVMSITNSIDVDATVFDVNGDPVSYRWTAEGPAAVTFIPSADVEDPTVAFADAGVYTLRLTIDDGMFGLAGEIYQEVVVTVSNPGCADAIAAGHVLFGDSNADCRVDMADFAAFAENWLACNDPLSDDPGCVNPFIR